MNLVEFLTKENHYSKSPINLFCDIETFQFNEAQGRKKPSLYKNQVFSVAVSYIVEGTIHTDCSYYDFEGFLEDIEKTLTVSRHIDLYFHNGNRYDNHYLLFQLLHDYPQINHRPAYVRNVKPEDNPDALTAKQLKKMTVLEKRIKAKTNLELTFRLNKSKLTYKTVDSLPKFNGVSLRKLGDNMHRLGLIDPKYLKTTLDYQKYSTDEDMTYTESKAFAEQIHANLTPDELTYIKNDVIILATAYLNYSKMYPGFDFSKITFSQNILEEYKVSPMAKIQLTGKVDSRRGFKYSEYDFRGENLFDYIKHFYKGGLNFYNDRYLNKIIPGPIVSFDLNSSYPNVMVKDKMPLYLVDYIDETRVVSVEDNPDYYHLYEVSIDEFNQLISHVDSINIRKYLVKYYSSLYENVYINTNTLKLINLFSTTPVESFTVLAALEFSTEYFDGRSVLIENYAIKMQGKNTQKLDATDPFDIKVLPQKNDVVFTQSQINTSKVIINGVYGLPALRAYYNFFHYDYQDDEIHSVPNGFANTERNEIFSVYVTSKALYNLLEPLQSLSGPEIDQYLYYGDTDSLYLNKKIADKVDSSYFNQLNLGAFKQEHEISEMFVLNHKKYAIHTPTEKQKIQIRSGGVPANTFDLDMPFEQFVATQFSAGVHLKTIRNYLTIWGTMAIYDADMTLEAGSVYPETMNEFTPMLARAALSEVSAKSDENINDNYDILYIDSPFGAFSASELTPRKKEPTLMPITQLISTQKYLKAEEGE